MRRPTEDQLKLLRKVVSAHRDDVMARFAELLHHVAADYVPPLVQDYVKALDAGHEAASNLLAHRPSSFEMYIEVYRNAIIERRLVIARQIEERRAKAIHRSILEKLDAELEPYDDLVKWVVNLRGYGTNYRVPQLVEFFPIERVEAQLRSKGAESRRREYDEKFHILQAPSLFLPDLDAARQAAALRGVNVAVAYIDIDHFKAFNTEHGEPFVDRNVLPTFMRHLEAHVYMRGFAYRYGGDEYCLLLNNTTPSEASASMDRLRGGLRELQYEGCKGRTTVSIGLAIVTPDCHLTGQEIEAAAARAKKFAKDNGRDRVAGYISGLLREKDLKILAAEPTEPTSEDDEAEGT